MKRDACITLLALLFIAAFLCAVPARGATYTCSSCTECTSYLQSGSSLVPGDTLSLTADIIDTGTTGCIKFGDYSGKDLDHVTLDCGGHSISSSDQSGGHTDNGYGIRINGYDFNINNIIIKDCDISYFSDGIYAFGSSNNEIINVNTAINNRGVVIADGDSNTLTDITATECYYECIRLDNSDSNTLNNINVHDGQSYFNHIGLYLLDSDSNRITNLASRNHETGLMLSGSNSNDFTGMTINDNNEGISLSTSAYNTINDSMIYNNNDFGISFYYSIYDQYSNAAENNLFYNNYLDNADNLMIRNDTAESTSTDYTNYWNVPKDCSSGTNILDGSCLGGNYWTDPDGGNYSDGCQDLDDDGICDSPYLILAGNTDEFPIAAPALADTVPPTLSFVPPTPSNGQTINTRDWAYVNVSSDEELGSCLLDWNDVNQTMSVTGTTCHLNQTDLSDAAYTYLVYATDLEGNMNATESRSLTISYASPDTVPPTLSFVPPTPSNGQTINTRDWAYVNVSSDEELNSCLLDWNDVNHTMSVTGTTCHLNQTDLSDAAYTYLVYATDLEGNMNATSTRTLSIDYGSSSLSIVDYYLPAIVESGEDVLIGVNATDDEGIDSVWAEITDPDGNGHRADLVNNGLVSWTPVLKGTYNVTIYANDTDGNVKNVSDSFYVDSGAILNLSVTDEDGDGMEASVEIYLSGSPNAIRDDTNSDGLFGFELVNGTYDIVVTAFDDEFRIKALEVSVDQDLELGISLDHTVNSEFDEIFAVNTTIQMSSAELRIYYGDMGFDNENLVLMVCEDWNMTTSECNGTWEDVSDVTNNESDEFLGFDVQGFSAFAMTEDSYCGDGSCDSGETVGNCPDDCFCNDGETRSCNVAHDGICSIGTETCTNNAWSGCPASVSESCNGLDDDCDGIVDNVGGGTSVAQTRCQCYNGASPLSTESCNGLDDNCDGLIDNGADCCTAGQTRNCGPATSNGLCQMGTASCNGGVWGDCIGAVYPVQEVCDDQLDNDCDGQVDEGCTVPQCTDGEIQSACSCEDVPRDSGYCCSGYFYQDGCPEFPYWWILVVAGVAMIVLVVVLVMVFRKDGKELTWDDLRRRYSPGTSNG